MTRHVKPLRALPPIVASLTKCSSTDSSSRKRGASATAAASNSSNCSNSSSSSSSSHAAVANICNSLQRYRRLLEAFNEALLAATSGLRQHGLLLSASKLFQQQPQQQYVVRCLGVPEVAITKDNVQAARAALHEAERQQRQHQQRGSKKVPLPRSLLQRSNMQQQVGRSTSTISRAASNNMKRFAKSQFIAYCNHRK